MGGLTDRELLELAAKAGFHVCGSRVNTPYLEHIPITEVVARFAALVAAAEREACAQVCEGMHEEDRPGDYAWAIRARGKA